MLVVAVGAVSVDAETVKGRDAGLIFVLPRALRRRCQVVAGLGRVLAVIFR